MKFTPLILFLLCGSVSAQNFKPDMAVSLSKSVALHLDTISDSQSGREAILTDGTIETSIRVACDPWVMRIEGTYLHLKPKGSFEISNGLFGEWFAPQSGTLFDNAMEMVCKAEVAE